MFANPEFNEKTKRNRNRYQCLPFCFCAGDDDEICEDAGYDDDDNNNSL